jgi:spermidine/putrescine transport system substrate-binding protein
LPIDKAKLTNLKNINAVYMNTPFDPDNKFSVPYAMSTTILGYNAEKMKELGLPTDTWAVIFEPKYLEKLKGRVTVLDSFQRTVRRGAQVSRLLRQRHGRKALEGGG